MQKQPMSPAEFKKQYEKDFITRLEKDSQIVIPRHNGITQIKAEMKKLERNL